jgi:hypothetical protein
LHTLHLQGTWDLRVATVEAESSDPACFSVKLPDGQVYYLKAASTTERQQWLNCIGVMKRALAEQQTSALSISSTGSAGQDDASIHSVDSSESRRSLVNVDFEEEGAEQERLTSRGDASAEDPRTSGNGKKKDIKRWDSSDSSDSAESELAQTSLALHHTSVLGTAASEHSDPVLDPPHGHPEAAGHEAHGQAQNSSHPKAAGFLGWTQSPQSNRTGFLSSIIALGTTVASTVTVASQQKPAAAGSSGPSSFSSSPRDSQMGSSTPAAAASTSPSKLSGFGAGGAGPSQREAHAEEESLLRTHPPVTSSNSIADIDFLASSSSDDDSIDGGSRRRSLNGLNVMGSLARMPSDIEGGSVAESIMDRNLLPGTFATGASSDDGSSGGSDPHAVALQRVHEKSLARVRSHLMSVLAERDAARNECSTLRRELSVSHAELAEAREQLAAFHSEKSLLRLNLQAREDQRDAATAELEGVRRELMEARMELAKLKTSFAESEQIRDETKFAAKRAAEQVRKMEAQAKAEADARARAVAKCARAEDEAKRLRRELEVARTTAAAIVNSGSRKSSTTAGAYAFGMFNSVMQRASQSMQPQANASSTPASSNRASLSGPSSGAPAEDEEDTTLEYSSTVAAELDNVDLDLDSPTIPGSPSANHRSGSPPYGGSGHSLPRNNSAGSGTHLSFTGNGRVASVSK